MRVQMIVTIRVPSEVLYEGREYEVDDALADALIRHGLARPVDASRKSVRRSPASEQAVSSEREER